MAFDLSWLWNTINNIVGTIQSWFQSLWTVAESIVNTGQGIFSGLIAFGSQLWDAFIKGLSAFGEWLYKQFQWIYDGIKYWVDVFGTWISNAISWIGSGISWIAQQIYNFGNWLYNGLVYIWNWIVNTVTGLWNALVSWFSGLANAISSWWASVIGGVNLWFTNLLKGFRQKIVQTIMADITITGAWKAGERILASRKLSDIGYGLIGIMVSPIVGALIGEIVNAVVPMPSTPIYPLIPDINPLAYTPPSLEIVTPTEKPAPYMGMTPTPPAVGAGLPYDVLLRIPTAPTYDYTTATKDASLTMPSTAYDLTLESTDGNLTMPTIAYEYEVS
jgi:hypothetical protein